jgi:hypothetical protein
MYPLFCKHEFYRRLRGGRISARLKMAMFSVACHFMDRTGTDIMFTPTQFARTTEALAATRTFCINEIRATFLLCVHYLSESLNWHVLSEMGSLVRMTYLCGLNDLDRPENCPFYEPGVTLDSEIEEWRSLWWCIYYLDTSCNALM